MLLNIHKYMHNVYHLMFVHQLLAMGLQHINLSIYTYIFRLIFQRVLSYISRSIFGYGSSGQGLRQF
jgi:hypothetical protein